MPRKNTSKSVAKSTAPKRQTMTAWVEPGAPHMLAWYDDGHSPDPIDPADVERHHLQNKVGERIEVYFADRDDQFVRVAKVDGPKTKAQGRAPQDDLGMRTCGSCLAGICIMNGNEVQRCDDCALFERDEDAAKAVHGLLKLLANEYRGLGSGDTVADAMDRLEFRCIDRCDICAEPRASQRALYVCARL